MRILAIDDNDLILSLLRDQITKMKLDIELDTTESGLDGLQLSRKNKYDLILMDIDMPKFNGVQISKMIRAREGHKNLIYAFSAVDDTLDEKVLNLFDGIYNKPYDANRLLDDIQTMNKKRH